MNKFLPLVIDLDGSLTYVDTLYESTLKLLIKHPIDVFRLPLWLYQGKATLKNRIAQKIEFNPETVPYNQELLEYLKEQKQRGRKLILCTAADSTIANKIADHLGIFDEVMASDGTTNLSSGQKAKALGSRFGLKGFDYVGNSTDDLAVWPSSNKAIIVNASPSLIKKAKTISDVEKVFPAPKQDISTWLRVFRIHQWVKNILLFMPLIAAHQLLNTALWLQLIIAFFAFSLCASSVYVTNDLFDLEDDREHPRKRKRPFASGRIPVLIGVGLVPLLLVSGFVLANYVGEQFLLLLTFYLLLTFAYTCLFKRIVLLDCITLAILYTLRVVSGAAAVEMPLSFWLLAFSVFLFLSLAFIKRYAELEIHLLSGQEKIKGRGYYLTDAVIVQTIGITAGYAATLVLALYLNSDAVVALYRFPEAMWAAIPIMLFWLSWIWLRAHRGEMHDDPIIFALKDKASLFSGVLFFLVLYLGAVGLP
jgi:4-hydroxybenzoate polyprenyltransferase/phosphoserine phosphatase